MNMDPKEKAVITRIPPSPTGHFHIGTARTALFNYLFAKQHGGSMLYRSEDTDRERSQDVFTAEIVEGLQWLGILWDNKELYKQSERSDIYKAYLEQLIESDRAYISTEPSKKDPEQDVSLVRLRNPNTVITFTDCIRGEIQFDTTELGDFIIARSLDDALYHFTVVVDDYEMGITHILRGEDHISNTPRQILIQEALGFSRPVYAHLPLILAPDKSKLSKRTGTVAIYEYQDMGIVPEALVNYLALLGWNPGTDQEFFTMEELLEQFSLEKIQKGGAVFDLKKLLWLNKLHVEQKTYAEQTAYVLEAIQNNTLQWSEVFTERFQRMTSVVLERYHSQKEIREAVAVGEYAYIFDRPTTEVSKLQWKSDQEPAAVLPRLKRVVELLSQASFATPEDIKSVIFPYAEEVGKGEVLWPYRMALTGKEKSPDPFTVSYALGKEETVARLEKACAKIEG